MIMPIQAGEGQPLEALNHIEMQTAKTVHITSPFSTTGTSQGHAKTICRYSIFFPKADKLHEHLNTEYKLSSMEMMPHN